MTPAEARPTVAPGTKAQAVRAQVKATGLTRSWVATLAVCFVLTRIVVYLSGNPYFDPDSYKYLSGADSLLAGKGLPPLYTDVAVNGGALHVVPGYAYFIYAVWQTIGISIRDIAVVQSIVSLLGYLALAHLISLWIGRAAAIATFAVLCLSPSIAWLEHSLMPDSMAAPLLMISFWAAALGSPASPKTTKRVGGALLSGFVVGLEILMRTSSQAYAPLPLLLAFLRRARMDRTLAWTALYVLAATAPLVPWIAHNHLHHGIYAVSASKGRNLYFNAVWAGTLDRAGELATYGLKQQPVPRSAYALADAALQRQIAAGLSLPKADAKLGEIAWKAYRTKPWKRVARERLSIVRGLFVPNDEPGSESLTPLGTSSEWYLANQNSSTQVRQVLEQRFRYEFSNDYVKAASKRPAPRPEARDAFKKWIELATFEGQPLLCAWLIAAALVLIRLRARWPLAVTLIAPPLAFLLAFAFFGAPVYRYQAGLHPFMLATIVAASSSLAVAAKRRLSPDFKKGRRLAGYPRNSW